MSQKSWLNVGWFNPYEYVGDALASHPSWRVAYLSQNVKVLVCDDGYFNLLIAQHGNPESARLSATNSIQMLRSEICAYFGQEIWNQVRHGIRA